MPPLPSSVSFSWRRDGKNLVHVDQTCYDSLYSQQQQKSSFKYRKEEEGRIIPRRYLRIGSTHRSLALEEKRKGPWLHKLPYIEALLKTSEREGNCIHPI